MARKTLAALLVTMLVALPAAPAETTTTTSSGQITSDDFSAPTLDTSVWSFVDPVGDSSLTMTGTEAEISVPAGVSHDLWSNALKAPRLLQAAPNGDFEVEAKFLSPVTTRYQLQGIVIQQDDTNMTLLELQHNGSSRRLIAGTITAGMATSRANVATSLDFPAYLRMARAGDTWTLRSSADGQSWSTLTTFDHAMSVAQVGFFVGNHESPESASPAHIGSVDYFFNTASPIFPEDGGVPSALDDSASTPVDVPVSIDVLANDSDPDGTLEPATVTVGTTPTSGTTAVDSATGAVTYSPNIGFSGTDSFTYTVKDDTGNTSNSATVTVAVVVNQAPVIDVWYGNEQSFGDLGRPQEWANVLGKVSDPDNAVASLTYSLNGGPELPLTMGTNNLRLAKVGDFNVEIDADDLVSGANAVTIRAIDELGAETLRTVTVNYTAGTVWPLPYSLDWSEVAGIQPAAHVVDGLWGIEADGVRTSAIGYDRLVDIGDQTWQNYEVTVPITIHSVGSSNAAVGLVMRWKGHTENPPHQEGMQPRLGYRPLGALAWYRYRNGADPRLEVVDGYEDPFSTSSYDASGFRLQEGITYTFRSQVQTRSDGHNYVLTVWEEGQPESSGITLEGLAPLGELTEGSLLLVAHRMDATFGDVTVNPINGLPTAADDAASTPVDIAVAIDVLANDSDPDGTLDPSTTTVGTAPASGTTAVDPATGAITYTPNPGFSGTDTFTYTVADNSGATSNAATVTVGVGVPNEAPNAVNDAASTPVDTAVAVDVLANDSDPDGTLDPATTTVGTAPAGGTTTIDPATGAITYTPNPGFSGTDTFTYTVADNSGATSNAATVSVSVGGSPSTGSGEITSDDFSSPTLDTSLWSFVDPVGDSSLALTGAEAEISVPAGVSHDLWGSALKAPRLLQAAPNGDFEVEVKFLSPVTTRYQLQGIVVQQDDTNLARFDIHHDGSTARLFAGTVVAGKGTARANVATTVDAPVYLRVARAGDTWTFRSSADGQTWTTVTSFSHAMTVAQVGLFAGNHQKPTSASPAHTGSADYFFNTASPIVPEDGGLNQAPTAVDDAASTPVDTAVAVDVLANDSDPDGTLDPSTTTVGTAPAGGTTTVDPATGAITYTPNPGFSGTDTFTYTVADNSGATSNAATVSVSVGTANQAPTAADDSASTTADTAVAVDVLANDSDPDGTLDPSTTTVGTAPAGGTTTVDPATGAITYTPNPGFSGTDTFTYTVADNSGATSNAATVSVSVGGSPSTGSGEITSDDFSSPTLDTSLWSFVDPVGDSSLALTGAEAEISVPAGVSHDLWGSALKAPRLLQAAPNGDFEVEVKFLSPVTTRYQLQGIVVQQDDTNLARFDIHHDGSTARLFAGTVVAGKGTARANVATTVDAPVYLRVARAGDTWTFRSSADGQTWTTVTSFSHAMTVAQVGLFAGNHQKPTSASPAHTGSADYFFNTASPIVPEDGGLNQAPTAVDDAASTPVDTAVAVDVLANDSDPDGTLDPSTTTVGTAPASGTTSVDAATGAVTYTPSVGFSGTDTFTYTVADNSGATSNAATVSVNVGTANQAPTAADDSASTTADTAVAVDVLANDSDPDGTLDPSTTTAGTAPAGGTTTVDPATGAITYTPNPGFSGTDTFTYTVADNSGATSNAATVSVSVGTANQAPTAADDSASTTADTAVAVDVLANDSDPDGTLDPSTTTVGTAPAGGTTTVDPATGAITYTPNPGFSGTDTFTYTVADNSGATSNAATVSVSVGGSPSTGSGEITSDDFSSPTLDTSLWSFVDPVGDSSLALTGAEAEISVPAGVSHDLWGSALKAPRLLQAAPNGDFEVEVKFLSPVTTRYQLQGIVVQQDDTNLARFDIHHDGSTARLFAGTVVAGKGTARANVATTVDAPVYLRVARAGDTWTFRSSADGQTWTTVTSFSHAMTVAQVGLFAGNHQKPTSASPAHTGSADYFFNTASPIVPEDGGLNQAPTAVDDAASTPVDTAVAVDVLANDSDPDGTLDPSTTTVGTAPAGGTTSVDAATGAVTYTPSVGFSGTDTFTYTVADNSGATSNAATVTVMVS